MISYGLYGLYSSSTLENSHCLRAEEEQYKVNQRQPRSQGLSKKTLLAGRRETLGTRLNQRPRWANS